ncbi:MATE family efflux transporter [Evansella cellulosilytica]|uniref:MATE efflux family protein n=1 Tax=Evansella cellulosilytica (strain ATCC 21833 / DSM 2522 / FERM P-1141 / JCM 9156 / N-4) TaxID=649639 RepID=E6U0T8_EVAC2|nr:MATE family efflux transporter [Evansella cellulosilytica]ADU29136.1 MATE efflux family protein [Evansella cellulosilytica DSM 2522]
MENNSAKKLSLFAITWPIFIEMTLHMFLRTADTFMLSRVSDEAVAAVGVANQLIMFMFFLFQFGSIGATVVIAQYLGAKKHDQIHKFSGNALSFNILFGIVVSVVIVSFTSFYLGFFHLTDELFAMARTYMLIVGSALVLQAMMLTLAAIIQAHGFTRYTMYVSVGMNIINIFGNYVLIFGAFGFPQLGVTGVAIATVFSQFLGVTANFIILYFKVKVKVRLIDYIKWKKDRLMKILSVGVPAALGQISYSASQIVTTGFITVLGPDMLTTRIYTLNILFFVIVLAISLGRGTQIVVGHLVGAGEMDKAYKEAFRSLKWNISLCLGVAVLLVIFREPLLGLFTSNPLIISTGAVLLIMGLILEPGRCLNIVLGQTLQATGDSRYVMLVSVIIIWAFSVPLYYVLGIHLGFGLIGIWIAFIVDEWIRGIYLLQRWRSGKWRAKALVKQEEDLKESV